MAAVTMHCLKSDQELPAGRSRKPRPKIGAKSAWEAGFVKAKAFPPMRAAWIDYAVLHR